MNLTNNQSSVIQTNNWFMAILCSLLLMPSVCFALPSDQQQRYHVSCRSIEYNSAQRTTVYIGNVKIKQGTTRIRADKVTVYQSPQHRIIREVAIGNLAHYSTIPQSGESRLYAQAKRIVYYPSKNTVLLLKDGYVTQDKNSFTGEHIWYNVALGQVRTKESGHKTQTRLVIEPKQRG